ncbi:FAD-dependent oxidoreductase [Nostoc sp. C117]|uniref:FAD-dependent oxidoreductase n=1 Tax=Nostoc sp. C117 TaxID=3349875 RepID=UPI00370D0E6A
MRTIDTDVCIVGGGPSGLTLALELVRRNLNVVVLEQAKAYTRSFRGESISPDSVYILDKLGIMEGLGEHDVLYTRQLELFENNQRVLHINLSDFKYDFKYPIDVPQPVMLEALIQKASQYEGFTILRGANCTELIENGEAIVGVKCKTEEEQLIINAHLTVGSDGRYSKTRDMAKCKYVKRMLERDFMWFKVPIPEHWKQKLSYRVKIDRDSHAVVIPSYPNLLRVGFNIPKGGIQKIKAQGIQYLHEKIAQIEPDLAEGAKKSITSWSDTTILDIFMTVVPQWYREGFVLIGDAAHTLSPILGQGVNHAIFDAVTLAPFVAKALTENPGSPVKASVLKEFQAIREKDLRPIRNMQLRQEKMLTLSTNLTVSLRTIFYRLFNSSGWLKAKMWQPVYYKHQARDLAS